MKLRELLAGGLVILAMIVYFFTPSSRFEEVGDKIDPLGSISKPATITPTVAPPAATPTTLPLAQAPGEPQPRLSQYWDPEKGWILVPDEHSFTGKTRKALGWFGATQYEILIEGRPYWALARIIQSEPEVVVATTTPTPPPTSPPAPSATTSTPAATATIATTTPTPPPTSPPSPGPTPAIPSPEGETTTRWWLVIPISGIAIYSAVRFLWDLFKLLDNLWSKRGGGDGSE